MQHFQFPERIISYMQHFNHLKRYRRPSKPSICSKAEENTSCRRTFVPEIPTQMHIHQYG